MSGVAAEGARPVRTIQTSPSDGRELLGDVREGFTNEGLPPTGSSDGCLLDPATPQDPLVLKDNRQLARGYPFDRRLEFDLKATMRIDGDHRWLRVGIVADLDLSRAQADCRRRPGGGKFLRRSDTGMFRSESRPVFRSQ